MNYRKGAVKPPPFRAGRSRASEKGEMAGSYRHAAPPASGVLSSGLPGRLRSRRIIGLGAAWALGYFHRTDPALAELNQLRDQMRSAADADRPAMFQQFREKMDGLTEAQLISIALVAIGAWRLLSARAVPAQRAAPVGASKR